jgi:hypothetical protein
MVLETISETGERHGDLSGAGENRWSGHMTDFRCTHRPDQDKCDRSDGYDCRSEMSPHSTLLFRSGTLKVAQ